MRKLTEKYADNPLKKLRAVLEMPQEALAQWIGVSLDQVRSFEIGRRGDGTLSEEMLSGIFKTFGAIWDQESKTWLFALYGPAIPYHKMHAEAFRNELKNEADFGRSVLIYRAIYKVMRLMQEIPRQAFNGFFWRLERLLGDWETEYATPALLKDFNRVALELTPMMDAAATKVEGFRKNCPELFKGEEKDVAKLIKGASQIHSAMMEAAADNQYRRFIHHNPNGAVWEEVKPNGGNGAEPVAMAPEPTRKKPARKRKGVTA